MARYHGLAALKEDSIEIGALGAGALVGAAAAKWVVGKLDSALRDSAKPAEYMFPGAGYIAALAPAAFGLLIQNQGTTRLSGAMKSASAGVAAGMVAFSLGKVVALAVSGTAQAATFTGKDGFLPFNGLGAMDDGVYDYSLGAYNSAEFGPGSVAAYMNGLGDAPTTTEMVMNGAPVDVQALNGLGAAPVSISTYAPLNTALTA